MGAIILASTGHEDMDRLSSPPNVVATGQKDGGGWQHSGRVDRWDWGGLTEDGLGLPDRGTADSSEKRWE